MIRKRLHVHVNPCYGEQGQLNGGIVVNDDELKYTLWLKPAAVVALRRWLKSGPSNSGDARGLGLLLGRTRWRYDPLWVGTRREDHEHGQFMVEIGPRRVHEGAVRLWLRIGAERLKAEIERALRAPQRRRNSGARNTPPGRKS